MKIKYFLLWISLLLLLAACRPSAQNTFEGQFKMLSQIESKYGTSFKTEQINDTPLNVEQIDALLNELNAWEKGLEAMKEGKDKEASLLLLKIRRNMLLAERSLKKAWAYGKKGNIFDGFACGDYKEIFNASILFNQSYEYGSSAMANLDELLSKYEFAQSIVGIDKNRPKFYFGPWNELRKLAKQRSTVENLCKDYIAEDENKTSV